MSARVHLKLALALCLAAALSALAAAPALAAPQLGLQLLRTDTPLHRGDERLVYEVKVKNTATANPSEGDELTCSSTPPSGNPASTITYQWLRSGVAIPSATSPKYTVQAADEGELVQCRVTATNDADGAGTAYAPIAATAVSLPPVAIEEVPSPAPLSGSSRPGVGNLPVAATPQATATVTAGSELLTDVFTAKGEGTLTSGSDVVTGAKATTGSFEDGQAIAGTGVPADTAISQVKETAPGVFEFTLIEARAAFGIEVPHPATASGTMGDLEAGALPFGPGQEISGPGIPAGTKVVKATKSGGLKGPEIVMSNKATASGTEVPVSGTAELTCSAPSGWSGTGVSWELKWLRNGTPIATGPAYTVQSADTAPPSILQCEAVGKDGGGNEAVAVSGVTFTEPKVPAPHSSPGIIPPTVSFANTTTAPVTLELELPAGEDTRPVRVVSGGDWDCVKEGPVGALHGYVKCVRDDLLAPGDTASAVQAFVSVGADPPVLMSAKARVSGGGAAEPPLAEDSFEIPAGPRLPFGFEAFSVAVLDEDGNEDTQLAGGHPFSAGASLAFKTHTRPDPFGPIKPQAVNGSPKVVRTDLPRGLVGNPEAVAEKCPSVDEVLELPSGCPAGSVVGGISIETSDVIFKDQPIYALEPEFGKPAEFAFGAAAIGLAFALVPELRAEDGYAVTLISAAVPKAPELFSVDAQLCGFGAKSVVGAGNETQFDGCRKAGEPGALEKPLITNPPRCAAEPPTTRISAESWEEPGVIAEAKASAPPLKGCEGPQFDPSISLVPTSKRADSPTGLDVELAMPTDGLEDPLGIAQANLEGSRVSLPVGMALDPAMASGLGACTSAQVKLGSNEEAQCPLSSKVGSVEVQTPLLAEPLKGNVYVAKQGENPFKSLLALYLVLSSKERGIEIKLAGKVTPDPVTGQLVTTVEENPEAPFSRLALHFNGGDRGPLINPPTCGTYEITSELSPWTAADPANPTPSEIVSSTSAFNVTQGPSGGPCPPNNVEAKLSAGLANPLAGATSPFTLRLSREDGSQRFKSLSVSMPPGLSAYLRGVPYCPDSVLASIPSTEGTGAAELASPSCPQASQVGRAIVGAGAGPSPYYVDTARVYLAGPYKGAPVSIAVVAPAVAGPFDLGNVVVRTALRVDPRTAQITAVSDPLPTILHGLLLDVRDIRVEVDRPSFTLAPTNCEEKSVSALVGGELGGSAAVAQRFQVGGCEDLGFKPKLRIDLHGGNRRGDYQRLTATLTARPGDANLGRVSVALPHSAFLAQEHIRTICTRVQFAAHQCPAASIYGKAKAITPLIEEPLEGPVYLRSSDNPLPDLVVALKGPDRLPVEIEAAGRTDSVHGGIRNTFDVLPDAPVSKFVLELKGAKKSLIVNSRNVCAQTQRATVRMKGQNGAPRNFRPVVHYGCGKGKQGSRGKR